MFVRNSSIARRDIVSLRVTLLQDCERLSWEELIILPSFGGSSDGEREGAAGATAHSAGRTRRVPSFEVLAEALSTTRLRASRRLRSLTRLTMERLSGCGRSVML